MMQGWRKACFLVLVLALLVHGLFQARTARMAQLETQS